VVWAPGLAAAPRLQGGAHRGHAAERPAAEVRPREVAHGAGVPAVRDEENSRLRVKVSHQQRGDVVIYQKVGVAVRLYEAELLLIAFPLEGPMSSKVKDENVVSAQVMA